MKRNSLIRAALWIAARAYMPVFIVRHEYCFTATLRRHYETSQSFTR